MRVFLLAGTAEAAHLSARLTEAGHDTVVSLAGATRHPAAYAGHVRRGGFGGAEGLEAFLRAEGIEALIDATHPFATTIAGNAAVAADRAGLPRLKLLRPPWPAEPGWIEVPDLASALDALPAGARALCTTGARRVDALGRRPDCRILLRAIEMPEDLPPGVRLLQARPPFTQSEEAALMRRERISHLITRNAGGEARARLDAARALGVVVLMIRRPPPPPGEAVATVGKALDWIARIDTR